MLGEKLSEEGTSHEKNVISLSSLAQSQYPTQQRRTNTAFAFRLAAEETPAAHGVVRVKGESLMEQDKSKLSFAFVRNKP